MHRVGADFYWLSIRHPRAFLRIWKAFGVDIIFANLLKFLSGFGAVAGGFFSVVTAKITTDGKAMAFIEVCKAVKVSKLKKSDINNNNNFFTWTISVHPCLI